jgi:hypothetical protein
MHANHMAKMKDDRDRDGTRGGVWELGTKL